jgi:hypothetical protein
MSDAKIESIARGQPIRAVWLNRIVGRVNEIPLAKQLPFGDSGTQESVGTTTVWTVTDTTTEEVIVESDDQSCSVTITRVTGFTAIDGSGNTITVTGF